MKTFEDDDSFEDEDSFEDKDSCENKDYFEDEDTFEDDKKNYFRSVDFNKLFLNKIYHS